MTHVLGSMEWLDSVCTSCEEELPEDECSESRRSCGHHCNHSWNQDQCCWCKKEFGEVAESGNAAASKAVGCESPAGSNPVLSSTFKRKINMLKKIKRLTWIMFGITVGWGAYILGKWKFFNQNVESWEGFVFIGLMVIVVFLCEIISPSF